jgi:hypothetical protein
MSNEPGTGEFVSSEQHEERQANERFVKEMYETAVPEQMRTDFAGAGINDKMQKLYGKTLDVHPTDEGKLSDEDKQSLVSAMAEVQSIIEEGPEENMDHLQGAIDVFANNIEVSQFGKLSEVIREEPEEESEVQTMAELGAKTEFVVKLKALSIDHAEAEKYYGAFKPIIDNYGDKEKLSAEEADVIRAHLVQGGVRKSHAEAVLSNLTDLPKEERDKVVNGMLEMQEEELEDVKVKEEEAKELIEGMEEELKEAAAILEDSDDIPDGDKKRFKTTLLRLQGTLKHYKIDKAAKGLVAVVVIALVAAVISQIWIMYQMNKLAKNK